VEGKGREGTARGLTISYLMEEVWPPKPGSPAPFCGFCLEPPKPDYQPVKALADLSQRELVELCRAHARLREQREKAFAKFAGRTPTPTPESLSDRLGRHYIRKFRTFPREAG
jgi:hypothetical protein